MKAFLTSLAVIAAISFGAYLVLDSLPSSSADVFQSDNVRL